jgi:hypothetical protein
LNERNAAGVVGYAETQSGVIPDGMRFAFGINGQGIRMKALFPLSENSQREQIATERSMRLTKGLKTAGRKRGPARMAPEAAKHIAQTLSKDESAGNGDKTVTVEAKIDVGFGNSLFLRGEGPGLNWSQGIPLACVDNSTWKWSCEANETLKFKLLLNDAVWAQGDNLVAAPGQKVEVSPAF